MNIIKSDQKNTREKKRQYLTATDYIMMTRRISKVFLIVHFVFGRFYLAAFLGEPAAFLAALGLAAFFAAAGFLAAVDFGFFGAAAFLTLGAAADLAFFAGLAFFAAAGLAVVALVFGFACRGFLAAFVPVDFGFELDRLAGLAFLGLAAAGAALVALAALVDAAGVAVAAPPVATFLADFVPADFDRARFLVPDAALELDVLFFVFLVDDDFFLAAVASPSLNEPLAPLPFVCLKCLALTPFFNANFKC